MVERRAGGYVDRGDGKGWVLDDSLPPVPATPAPRVPGPAAPPTQQVAGGWVLTPPAEPIAPEPEPPAAPAPEPEPEPPVESEPEPEPEPPIEASEDGPSDAEVRAWAKEAGVDVPARGRLSKQIIERYLNRESES